MQISVVISAFNEAESLPELKNWIEKVMNENNFTYEVIFIDDGSRDNSWKIIEEFNNENPCIKGIKFRRNYGKSAAINKGFIAAQGDVVITMDADLQDSPNEIPELYKMIAEEGYDLVSGWKKKRYDPLSKTIPTRIYNAATRKMTGTKLHDMNCGLKAYSKDVVKTVEVYGEMHRYIPAIAKWAGFTKIGEKVVEHRKRPYGTSKFGVERFFYGFLDLLSISFISKFGKRPMHIFGTLGLLVFALGFGIFSWLVFAKYFLEKYNMTERPMFFFALLCIVMGTLLFTSGFLGELIVRNSPARNEYNIEKTLGVGGKLQQ